MELKSLLVPAPELVDRAAALLRDARSVVLFTGAGVSAESGIPTFRSGANAMWNDRDVSRYATPGGFRANAKDAWAWYCMRHEMCARVEPNAGHRAIVEIERRAPDFLLITQNVDGLHRRAGSETILELHGNLREVRCFGCGVVTPWPSLPAEPVCGDCAGLLRPNVVFFEENLPEGAMERAREATASCDVLISVGTSNLVWPARELPDFALACGATVMIVNPEMEGQLSASGRVLHLPGRSGDVLPRVVRQAWPAA